MLIESPVYYFSSYIYNITFINTNENIHIILVFENGTFYRKHCTLSVILSSE